MPDGPSFNLSHKTLFPDGVSTAWHGEVKGVLGFVAGAQGLGRRGP